MVPAALAATMPAYWKMTEEPAGMGFRVMPAMSLGESGLAFGLPEVPKVRDVTPADSVTCACGGDVPSGNWYGRCVANGDALSSQTLLGKVLMAGKQCGRWWMITSYLACAALTGPA